MPFEIVGLFEIWYFRFCFLYTILTKPRLSGLDCCGDNCYRKSFADGKQSDLPVGATTERRALFNPFSESLDVIIILDSVFSLIQNLSNY